MTTSTAFCGTWTDAEICLQLHCRGFFPRGGGRVELGVHALATGRCLPAVQLTERGKVLRVTIRAFAAGAVKIATAERMARAAQIILKKVICALVLFTAVDMHCILLISQFAGSQGRRGGHHSDGIPQPQDFPCCGW